MFYHCAEAGRLREAHARNPHQRFAGLRMPASKSVLTLPLPLTRFHMLWSERPCVRLASLKARRLYFRLAQFVLL